MLPIKAMAILFVLGATVGVTFDAFHVHSGTSGYANPAIFGVAWWVFPLFGGAAVAIGNFNVQFDRLVNRRLPEPSWPNALSAILYLGVPYFCTSYLPVDNQTMFVLLVVAVAGAWFLYDSSAYALIISSLVAVVGSAVEISIVSTGEFYYTSPQFMGVPLWLFWLYVLASFTLGHLARKLGYAFS